NDLTNAPRGLVREFVEKHNEWSQCNHKTFNRIMVHTVYLMAIPEDLKIIIEVHGGSNNNYALIVDIAEPQRKHKIVFIGPPGHVIVSERLRRASRTLMMGKIKANIIGFPIMIKASEVPGSPIFIMRLARDARHLEVQALADQYGNVISLFGRDCSVQRRHQKIIEEAHVTIKKQETFELMERVAVRLTKLVGRVSAGTVEYLYSHEIDFFCFLELNPRLQVEHPTTEMVSGGNIPAQLQIATGIPFHQIRDIRVDVIFPNSDIVHELSFRSTNVRGRFSVNYAGGLHEFADFNLVIFSLMVRIVKKSRKNMIVALTELSTRRNFRNTVEYLVKLPETQASKKIV
ncbi:3903_t:CDS:2, partial [Funneliformis geosporum]